MVRHAEFFIQLLQQRDDLRLDRDVQRGGGFVGDEQFGLIGQGHGNDHPLGHAAAELVRVLLQTTLRIGNPHSPHQGQGSFTGLGVTDVLMGADRLDDLSPDSQQRIESANRILEDHRDVIAPNPAECPAVNLHQVTSIEDDLALHDASRSVDQAQDG